MTTYDRRTFLKRSAMATATVAANGLLLPSVIGRTVATNQRGTDHPFFTQAKNHPEVIAHRGGDGQWPGETMYAYKNAIDLGVDVLEMDVYLTKRDNNAEGELVLMHDNDIRTTTEFKGKKRDAEVHNFTLKTLKELNAAYKWSPGPKDCHPFCDSSDKDLKVTSLKEIFSEFQGVRMIIEMKDAGSKYSPAAVLAKMICKTKMWDKVLIASQSDDYMREFRGLCPEVATSASKPELKKFATDLFGKSYRPNTDALQMIDEFWDIKLLSAGFVERAHQANVNLPVHAWTVNTLDSMRRMIDLKVDGIITDYPGPLLALLGRKMPGVKVSTTCSPKPACVQ